MRAADIVGKKVKRVDQERMATRWDAETDKESDFVWNVTSIEFEGGGTLFLVPVETDGDPVVEAWYRRSSLTRDQMMKEMLPRLNKLFGLPYESLDDHEEIDEFQREFDERIETKQQEDE